MVSVLLDTCVLSELQRTDGEQAVRAKVAEFEPRQLFVSVVTFGEVVKGITLLGSSAKKRRLASWLLDLEQQFGDRILPIDTETARLLGEVSARAQLNGVSIPAVDGMIVATGLRHGLHVMTRNVKHFAATGIPLINPWEADE